MQIYLNQTRPSTVFRLIPEFLILTDTQTDETWELKFDNGGFQLSYAAMCAMLKRADLESKGFKKLVTTTEVQEEESGKSIFQASSICVHVL